MPQGRFVSQLTACIVDPMAHIVRDELDQNWSWNTIGARLAYPVRASYFPWLEWDANCGCQAKDKGIRIIILWFSWFHPGRVGNAEGITPGVLEELSEFSLQRMFFIVDFG